MSELRDNLLTPERRAEAAKLQADLAARNTGVKTRHPAYANFLHGRARAQAALTEVGALLAADSVDREAFKQAQERYGEAMALEGQYGLALANSSDPARRADYQAHARALENCNVKLCACPPVVRRGPVPQ